MSARQSFLVDPVPCACGCKRSVFQSRRGQKFFSRACGKRDENRRKRKTQPREPKPGTLGCLSVGNVFKTASGRYGIVFKKRGDSIEVAWYDWPDDWPSQKMDPELSVKQVKLVPDKDARATARRVQHRPDMDEIAEWGPGRFVIHRRKPGKFRVTA